MVDFYELDEHGNSTLVRTISSESIRACPHYILEPFHYRQPGDTCRCDDPKHVEMEEWGYAWDGQRWV